MNEARDRDLQVSPENTTGARQRLLLLVVAFNAENTIRNVLHGIPAALAEEYDVEILVIDDASIDATFDRTNTLEEAGSLPFPLRLLVNAREQGYGGTQKLGYRYAIENGFDLVALLHGDGAYDPARLPEMLAPLRSAATDAVLGSRMLGPDGRRPRGMPLYKTLGTRVLSRFQNRILRTQLSEWHCGYRAFRVDALEKLPFELNTNELHFDTEVIIQLVFAGLRIQEVGIPPYHGRDIRILTGLRYARDVMRAVLRARVQEMMLFHDPRFDCRVDSRENAHYQLKLDFDSTHTRVLTLIEPGSRILELGCAGGYFASLLETELGCKVTGVDTEPLAQGVTLDRFVQWNLDDGLPPVDISSYDLVVMLDVIEHLLRPEAFVSALHAATSTESRTCVVMTTGNIAFVLQRLMLLLGQFNYGKRGILDLTHTRLFTFGTLARLFEQRGFQVIRQEGVPAPFPLATRSRRIARALLTLNRFAIVPMRRLFSYQMLMVMRPRRSLDSLLREAEQATALRQ
ncbi:MAG: glycosyltransferase [Myxococcales bacterium]|jgi:glycosyltransferase involved in cell wall biosynthesis|nr:MAG: glycosyltransferase [Myxococcales bacterium]